MRTFSWGLVLVIAWLALIGVTVWSYAAAEVEPPVWDALSYAAKAFYFWDAIGHGNIFNPLNLPPTVRPPGTILMSYPFGFTTAFAGYYFRSIFWPIILLTAAVYIVGHSRETSQPSSWLISTMAMTLCGMPVLYQFELNDTLRAISFWGLVDNFLAGVAAVAIASAVRSVRTLSPWWAIVAALAAALSFMIKPAGLLVMAVVGASWLILIGFRIGWKPTRLRQPALARYFAIGLFGAATIYGLTIAAAFFSEYLSANNIAWGSRALAVLQHDFSISANFGVLYFFVQHSFGYVVPLLIGAGLICAFVTRGEIGAAVVAVVCLVVGIWFWIFETELTQIRYFLPFGAMAFVVVTPSLLFRFGSLPSGVRIGLAAVILAPTAAVTLLLLHPQPPLSWQRLLNVNLSSGLFRAENQQASAFLDMVRSEGAPSVFMLELNSPSRNFVAVVEYRSFLNPSLGRASIKLPVDWSRTTTYRLQEILRTDYVTFGPIRDDVEREAILKSRTITNFAAETRLMKAWFSTLGPADGVAFISETRVRLLRIVNHDLFGGALKRLRGEYDWRPAFREANP